MKDHMLHSGLFYTVEEIMTACSNSLHVKGGSYLAASLRKRKRPKRHDLK